eukprot:4893654-Pleurochrysis_carterae.AAC.1
MPSGVASGPSTRPDRGLRANTSPRRQVAGSERPEAPRWSVGRPPKAPRPRRPSPISKERGA